MNSQPTNSQSANSQPANSQPAKQHEAYVRVSTGLDTLDDILHGGLPGGELYVVNGSPGSGKTTLALHFLQEGATKGEKVICLALAQRVESLKQTAKSVGLDVSNVTFYDLSTVSALKEMTERQTIFDTSEVELVETMRAIVAAIDAEAPTRVVFDGVSQLRMLANNAMTYRQQLFMLRDYMTTREITVVLTDSQDAASGDQELVSMAHGVITLMVETTTHGSAHRYLKISKMRASAYEPGMHDVEIDQTGLQVYQSHRYAQGTKLASRQSANLPEPTLRNSGIPELDKLISGGLHAGTTCLMLGPSGTGKTSIATLFAHRLATTGGKASVFLFDESIKTFLRRSKGLGMDLAPLIESDLLHIHELSFGNITPGKFASLIDRDVDEWGAQIVAIDTLTGYLNSMPTKARLISQMHELTRRLNQKDVLTFLMVAQHGVIGLTMDVSIDISYLADTVLLFRHFETQGQLRQAISVYKNRYGAHEKQICEVILQHGGIQISHALGNFSGILSGLPEYKDAGIKNVIATDSMESDAAS
ncbi:MAG: ATPase domain-containing protein [Cyanobacteria bacterium J06631_9]